MISFTLPAGINFSSSNLPASDLAPALCRIASFIQVMEPHGTQLQTFEDWWEHDGLFFSKGSITVHELFEIVQSPRSLLAAMPGDDYVVIGVAPIHRQWYLRFGLNWDDEGYELNGKFDITLPVEVIARFKQEIISYLQLPIIEQNAETYYQSISSA